MDAVQWYSPACFMSEITLYVQLLLLQMIRRAARMEK